MTTIPARAKARGERALLALLRRLPAEVQARVRAGLSPVGRLDYPHATIDMALGSGWQVYRLRSCAKEPETVAWLERELRPGDCLYDIGANVGAYALVAFAVTGGLARVVALEPGFATFPELCKNIELNGAGRGIVPLPFALGETTHLGEMRYSDTSAGAARHHWDGGNGLTLATACYRLDDLIETFGLPAPTLIKLDVDGPELEVLRGAPRTLASPALRGCLVELDVSTATHREIVAWLAEHGLREASRHVRGGGGDTYNFIFTRG